MKANVFLLTTDKNNEDTVRNVISNDYNLSCVDKSDLMVLMYEKEPVMLIVDLDCFEENTIEMIQSIIAVEYLSVVYVYSNRNKITANVNNKTLLRIDNISNTLTLMADQAYAFKSKYKSVTENYETINLLNSVVKASLTKYIESDFMINELLDSVFASNIFLSNKPEIVWFVSESNGKYFYVMFKLESSSYIEKLSSEIEESDSFKFDIYAENGFCKNFNDIEMSDINFSKDNLPGIMRDNVLVINNFVGFSVDKLTLIGMNYKDKVSNYDIDIIKALSINIDLMNTIKSQMSKLEDAFVNTCNALARAAEVNDDNTGKHIKRVNYYSKLIAEQLGLQCDYVKKIFISAQMHDVGKIYVDKNILQKPGKLTDEEFEEIKLHTVYGEKIIGNSEYLEFSAEIARNHHEKYDGSGYPNHKKNEEIPLSARIVAIGDIYDALRSERPYKKGFSHEEAYKIITEGDGRVMPKHFDPDVLEAFKKVDKGFDRIFAALKD